MCDTLIKITPQGRVFGKNSDRSPNEPNLVRFYPQTTRKGSINCTYMTIQESYTAQAMILVRPSWLWGGEMGVNHSGVSIGNEAVFTRSKDKKTPRLTGMDLLRLALEKATNAHEAVEWIITMLEKYGQGGNCGYDKAFYYDNSFLITDAKEAFILETSAREWVVRCVSTEGNISNRLLKTTDYVRTSPHAPHHFAHVNSEPVITHFSQARVREKQALCALKAQGSFDTPEMIEALSQHHPRDQKTLFTRGSVRSVCMHYSLLGDHTTSSMIVSYKNGRFLTWVTGTSSPCLSVFKPVLFDSLSAPLFDQDQDSLSYWLRNERIRRAIYAGIIDHHAYQKEKICLQDRIMALAAPLTRSKTSISESRAILEEISTAETQWLESYDDDLHTLMHRPSGPNRAWAKKNRLLGINPFSLNYRDRT